MSDITPTAMSPAQLADFLSRAGGAATTESIEQDIASGAPTNADGTINLLHYAAWLCKG